MNKGLKKSGMRTHVRISVLVYALALFPVNLQAEEI